MGGSGCGELCRNVSEVSEENEEKKRTFSQNSLSPDWDLNPDPPEYEAIVLLIRTERFVLLCFVFVWFLFGFVTLM